MSWDAQVQSDKGGGSVSRITPTLTLTQLDRIRRVWYIYLSIYLSIHPSVYDR